MDEQLEMICMSYDMDDIIEMADLNPVHVLKLLVEEGLVDLSLFLEDDLDEST